MVAVLILFDLQENLKEINVGQLVKTRYLFPSGRQSTPDVLSVRDVKTIHIAGRANEKPGVTLVTPRIKTLRPGDKVIVTGRVGSGAPTSDWAMVIDRRTSRSSYTGLAQCVAPPHDELFSITYLLEPEDLKFPFMIRANPWGNSTGYMDYFLDSVLISRNDKTSDHEIDTRNVIYTLAGDDSFDKLKVGDVHKFIKAAGSPVFTVFMQDGKKNVRIERRVNNWDGLDVWFPGMNLKQGNVYKITVHGKVDGHAPSGASMMMQVLPGFIWRSEAQVSDNQEFTLSHTFPAMELKTLDSVRIATNSPGADMSFTINTIEVTAATSKGAN
ncbi:MAG: hypothetical protein FWF80_04935 [Defluviitaleaceae bacterium]|nr:hypothetical protein [Defluviitaleaceae bacterium]